MKIVLVIPSLLPGGAERVVSILSQNWVNKKFDVEIVLLTKTNKFYNLDPRIKITEFDYKINLKGIRKIFSLIKLAFKFRKHLSSSRPDFVLSFMNKYNVFTLIALKGLGIKTIVSERDSPTEVLPKITEFLRKRTYKYANGIICQSELSKKYIIERTGNKNVISLANPIYRNKKFKSRNIDNKKNIIINVGRLVPKKGQKYLIEAFSKLNNKKWELYFIGDGPLKSELVELAKSLEIDDRVKFIGFIKDFEHWFSKSKIFAFTSVLEGYPNALAEAMVNGMACVSFDCDTGPRDIIQDGTNGFLIEVGNVSQLTEKIESLIKNNDLISEFSANALDLYERVNPSYICDQYLNFCIKS